MHDMRSIQINEGWNFGPGTPDPRAHLTREPGGRAVRLPHDYMIEGNVCPDAPSAAASGYYNAGVAWYMKEIEIPEGWANDQVYLRFDGAMMNATVEVNGDKVCLHHYGYTPFAADITDKVYPGEKNRITITVNPSMQPNSRWYSGAGLFRGVELVHTPKVHLTFGGVSAYTKKIEYAEDGTTGTAYLQVSAEVKNELSENRIADVTFSLLRDDTGETVKESKTLVQAEPLSTALARMTLTVDEPLLWCAETPNLYRLQVRVREKGTYKTHMVPVSTPTEDTDEVLFGIRTVEADVKHGLRINGQTVKLRGGCLHHDNGVIGAVSLYDAEVRKVRILKGIGFNAIRTTHNPPSAALIEACDREGMYVFDEAFDAWGMGKQPGDYNQFFETDWEEDLSAFVRRDRCHPSVIIWSTGNEITERAGLGRGYVWASRLAEAVRSLDPSRPVSNGICSFWNGLDDHLMGAQMKKDQAAAGQQNADISGKGDRMWEEYTEGFAGGLDIVGYNYMEGKYGQDHGLFPERVMLGSENYPREVGMHWPMIEKTPYVIGEFTWTAWDYIGEAGIGKGAFLEPGDPRIQNPWALMASTYPWRTADDADVDICGHVLPQGVYRSIVWGSGKTAVFSYEPQATGKVEVLSPWGFPQVRSCWNWQGFEGQTVRVLAFSQAEEVELRLNGRSVGKIRQGDSMVHGMPCTVLFEVPYEAGRLEAIGYTDGCEVSRGYLQTTSPVQEIRLTAEASGKELTYVDVELVDDSGAVVPDADIQLQAHVDGPAELLGFGSGNPITEENYCTGAFTSYRGRALAVLRTRGQTGKVKLTVSAVGLPDASIRMSAPDKEKEKE